jgi:hypothetical protein
MGLGYQRSKVASRLTEQFGGFIRMKGMDIQHVEPFVHLIRGRQVMLDTDLARIYGVPTKYLNLQVKRNRSRFPDDFMFRLSAEESSNLRLQIATSSWGGRRYWPQAFTQEGIAMLSGVLHSERAVEVNIAIMRAFVKLRQALTIDGGMAERMEKAEQALLGLEKEQGEHAVAIHELFAEFRRLAREAGG